MNKTLFFGFLVIPTHANARARTAGSRALTAFPFLTRMLPVVLPQLVSSVQHNNMDAGGGLLQIMWKKCIYYSSKMKKKYEAGPMIKRYEAFM